MKPLYVKFHQPVRVGTDYTTHVFGNTLDITFESGILTIDGEKLKTKVIVFTSNIESMEVIKDAKDSG